MESDKFYNRAAAGGRLSDSERIRLTPMHLFQLALVGVFNLTQGERDRLEPNHLFQLAIAGVLELSERDQKKLTAAEIRLILESKEKPV